MGRTHLTALLLAAALSVPGWVAGPAAAADPGTVVASRCQGDAGHGTLTEHVETGPLGSMTYYVYVPDSVRAHPAVVLHLHGANDDVRDVMCRSRLNEVARDNGFVAVYPQEDPDNGANGIWDWAGSAYAGRAGRAPSLLAEIARRVVADQHADQNRVFVSGISAGGGMAVVAAATYPDVFRAVAVEVGCMYAGLQCNPTSPQPNSTLDPDVSALEAYQAMGSAARRIPLLVSSGTLDPIAAVTNQDALVQQWLGTNDWIDDGAANGSIPRTPAATWTGSTNGLSYTVKEWDDARGYQLVEQYAIDGMLHAYAGGQPLSATDLATVNPLGPNMREVAWEFFDAQTRRGGPPSGVRSADGG